MFSIFLWFNPLWISLKVHKLFFYIDLSLRWQDQIWKIWVYAWFKYWLWLFTVDIYCTLPYHVVSVHGIWWFSRTNFNAVNNGALSWKRWKLFCLLQFNFYYSSIVLNLIFYVHALISLGILCFPNFYISWPFNKRI